MRLHVDLHRSCQGRKDKSDFVAAAEGGTSPAVSGPTTSTPATLQKIVASAALTNPYPLAPDVLLLSQTVAVEQREERARALGFELFTGTKPERDPLGPGRPDRPISARATWDPLHFATVEREPGQRVSVLTLVVPEQTIIRTNSPVEFNGRINGELTARFSGPTQFKLPPGRSLGRLFHDVAVVHQGAVAIQTDTNRWRRRCRRTSTSAASRVPPPGF